MIGSHKYQLSNDASQMYNDVLKKIDNALYQYLINPCGEIVIHARGGYCVLGDLVPFFSDTKSEILENVRLATRFLIRTNLMNSIYSDEVKRTNRVGLSMTGIHEFAWKFFGYGFRDLIEEKLSQDFWDFINLMRLTHEDESAVYASELNLNIPHTGTTCKPSGSISKLFNLTEGAHLPAHRWYLRWVQIQNDSPLLKQYEKEGYPMKPLFSFPNVTAVGFPTCPLISTLGMGNKMVLASEATPEEQYKWLMLLEKYWLGPKGNQISYTLKLDKEKVSLEQYRKTVLEFQPKVRCCAVMPTPGKNELASLYEYLPEEEITESEYNNLMSRINKKTDEDFDEKELLCSSGSCPL